MQPQNELTEVAVVLDRSGSMMSIRDDMEGGLWSTILEQHQQPGRCRVSLFQFDDVWEVRFISRPSGEITREDCQLAPRGATALNDAVTKSLVALEHHFRRDDIEIPAHVFVIVITDGCENASKECTASDARAAIRRATGKLGWHFVFLAADPDGFQDGTRLVRSTAGSAGTFSRRKSMIMMGRASEAVSRARTGLPFVVAPEDDGEVETSIPRGGS